VRSEGKKNLKHAIRVPLCKYTFVM